MKLESPGLKRVLIFLLSLLPASVWLSCGSSTPSTSTQTSGLKDRVFITNRVSAGSLSAGVYIVDASRDVSSGAAAISAGKTTERMVVTPNRVQIIVFSGNGFQFSDNELTVINNAAEGGGAN